MEFSKGQRIRYTLDNLGCVKSDHIVMAGDIGTYHGPALEMAGEGEGSWHITTVMVSVEDGMAVYVCPVHESMFEPAEG
jgi:hypothetical protein